MTLGVEVMVDNTSVSSLCCGCHQISQHVMLKHNGRVVTGSLEVLNMAESERITHIDPSVDCVAKYLLGTEENNGLLIDFLNAVLFLEGSERVVDVTITNPFNEKTFMEEKTTALDIRARDQRGHTFHIEVQVVTHQDLPQRMVYYWSSIYSSQLKRTEGYGELKPVISIWVLVDPLFPDVEVVHIPFGWHSNERSLSLIEEDLIHVLQLRFLPNDDSIEKGSTFWTWIKLFRDGASIDLDNPPEWAKEEMVMALRQFTQDEKRRSLYFARLDAKRDAMAYHQTTQKNLKMLKQERDQEKTRADQAETRADQAFQEKELERLRADQAETKASQAVAKASQAEEARRRLEAKLREMGFDPEQI